MRILVVGGSGYIGGRLVLLLASRGHDLVLLGRNPAPLGARFPQARVVEGDLRDARALRSALDGVELAYYLAHSMDGDPSGFVQTDRAAADSFGAAAAAAGVTRVVYLGALAGPGATRSLHIASRHETGSILARHGVPVTEFRAGVVVGSGSAAFELIRSLAERLPIMLAPRWLSSPCQPIGIADVLDYLLGAIDHPEIDGVVEIGGPNVLCYGDMIDAYARRRGLRRRLRIPVPIAAARLSSYLVSLPTPIPSGVARRLIEAALANATVRVGGPALAFGLVPLGFEEVLRRAIDRSDRHAVESTWFDAYRARRRQTLPGTLPGKLPGKRLLTDRRVLNVMAAGERVFAEVERVGGATGWPYANILWRIRGVADRAAGGVGMRLGRRDPERLRVGDPVDLWRVEEIRRPELLRLRDAMKLPGRAWLQYEVLPRSDGSGSILVQTAYFEPHGLGGLLYWYGLMPVHPWIFRGMIAELAVRAARAGGDVAHPV